MEQVNFKNLNWPEEKWVGTEYLLKCVKNAKRRVHSKRLYPRKTWLCTSLELKMSQLNPRNQDTHRKSKVSLNNFFSCLEPTVHTIHLFNQHYLYTRSLSFFFCLIFIWPASYSNPPNKLTKYMDSNNASLE